ncbi:MAG TPA: hypothetical protein VF469_15440, partial [Kofleriaceae bacterium]
VAGTISRASVASGWYRAAWVDLQIAREQPDLDRALPILLGDLDRASARDLPSLTRPSPDEIEALWAIPERAVLAYISLRWAATSTSPGSRRDRW